MANQFTVDLYDKSFNTPAYTPVKIKVTNFSEIAKGGYEQAQLTLEGSREDMGDALAWLRYYVQIRNQYGTIVWAGIITQIHVDLGGLEIGLSLDDMYNRVAVSYSYDDITGKASSGVTTWADNLDSEAAFGIKEVLRTHGDMEAAEAATLRDKDLLDDGPAWPIKLLTIGSGNSDETTGSIVCSGVWSTLDWQLWNQLGGVERYDTSGNFAHLLGWGLTSNLIGFEGSQDHIHDLNGRLKELRTDDQIVVSGAVNSLNNGTMKVKSSASIVDPVNPTTHVAFTSLGISFDPNDDLHSSSSGFGFVQANELLKVSGSAHNNGYYFAKSDLSADHITVTPNTIAKEYGGASVTVEQGHSIGVTPTTLISEYPANTITMTALGSIVAQSFTLSVNKSFTVKEIYIRLKIVGLPADQISVALRADVSGLPAGTSLESVQVYGNTMSEDMNWVKFTFTNTLTLTYGTTYWLLVARTGANSTSDYYQLDLNDDAAYAGGALKLWNGSTWVARAWGTDNKTADMPFQIWGAQETTSQINDILAAKGQFIQGIDIQSASGIFKRLYRDQDQTAKVEIETMMDTGINLGKRILSRVDYNRIAHIYEERSYDSSSAPLLNTNGQLLDTDGGQREPGKLHIGWVTLVGLPPNVGQLSKISPVFIERCEYDATNDKYSALDPKSAPNPWDAVTLL